MLFDKGNNRYCYIAKSSANSYVVFFINVDISTKKQPDFIANWTANLRVI